MNQNPNEISNNYRNDSMHVNCPPFVFKVVIPLVLPGKKNLYKGDYENEKSSNG